MPFYDLWLLLPFCDLWFLAILLFFETRGIMPDWCYGSLAILGTPGRHYVTDGVTAYGTWYSVLVYSFIQSSRLV